MALSYLSTDGLALALYSTQRPNDVFFRYFFAARLAILTLGVLIALANFWTKQTGHRLPSLTDMTPQLYWRLVLMAVWLPKFLFLKRFVALSPIGLYLDFSFATIVIGVMLVELNQQRWVRGRLARVTERVHELTAKAELTELQTQAYRAHVTSKNRQSRSTSLSWRLVEVYISLVTGAVVSMIASQLVK